MMRRSLTLLAVAAFLAPVITLAHAQRAVRNNDIDLCSKNDVPQEAAVAACTRLIQGPGTQKRFMPALYYQRASHYLRWNEHDKAIADYDMVISLDPRMRTAHGNRGLAFYRKGDYDRAISDFSEELRINPNQGDYSNRGMAWARKGDSDRALRDFDDAVRLDRNNIANLNNRGLAYLGRRDAERAIDDFTEALRIDPGYTAAFTNRGAAHEAKSDIERARADYRMAIELPAKHSNGRYAQDVARDRLAALNGTGPAVPPPHSLGIGPHLNAATAPAAPVSPPAAAPPAPAPQRHEAAAAPASAPAQAPQPGPAIAAPVQTFKRKVALIIGNGKYRHASELANPRNDAADMSAALRKLGFDVVEGRDLDRAGMDNAIRQFGRKLDGADLALFFYAGHGLQVNGKNYLVPVDARLERAGDLQLDTVDVGLVLGQMENDSRVNLVFLDACRDNPLSRSLARSMGTRSTSVGAGLAQIQSAIGTMIAYATQPDNVALDGDGRNSPFTTALLKHLPTPGLDIGTVMRRVRTDVIATTGRKQVPWDHSSLTGDVILAR